VVPARAAELIGIRSTADRPAELERALNLVLQEVGPGFAVRRFASGGKPSALVHLPRATGPFRIILNAHLDVVPGRPAQFQARIDGDRLYGRGTHDMKIAALVLAAVFRELAAKVPYPLALQLVTDEEVGGADGTAHQIAEGVRGGFVLIGEQSGLRVVTESKGLAQVRLTAHGRAAHAAYPWLGRNAVLLLTAALDRIMRRYPVPAGERWATTVNVARLETPNRAVNQVPAEATAWLDIRFPPGDGDVVATLRDAPGRPGGRGGRPAAPGRRRGRRAGHAAAQARRRGRAALLRPGRRRGDLRPGRRRPARPRGVRRPAHAGALP
jgi:succinyl-diaminopimelate desuccinylase